jgi:glycerol-3-phosphate dehydrogenase
MATSLNASVAVIGGGVVGAAMLYTLAHRGVAAVLVEADPDLAYSASGTNSGVLHTGFDSTPGELETDLILRAAPLRARVLQALDVPVIASGAVLRPRKDEDHETICALAAGARANGVETQIRQSDGALLVPGESVTDPVAFTLAMARSAVAAGAQVLLDAKVTGIDQGQEGLDVRLADGRQVHADVVINCAGLYADEVARLVGDDSFEIYPRKGEFFVFELPDGQRLEQILLPVPTKRTKGVLVFPTIDGKVIAGPTAHDDEDKTDWTVRPEARDEILPKAVEQFPALADLEPIASYAGLRPAGRGSNYVIGPSAACDRLINVAAIRSTGLTASLGIAAHVAELLPERGVAVADELATPTAPDAEPHESSPWWQRTASRRAAATETAER